MQAFLCTQSGANEGCTSIAFKDAASGQQDSLCTYIPSSNGELQNYLSSQCFPTFYFSFFWIKCLVLGLWLTSNKTVAVSSIAHIKSRDSQHLHKVTFPHLPTVAKIGVLFWSYCKFSVQYNSINQREQKYGSVLDSYILFTHSDKYLLINCHRLGIVLGSGDQNRQKSSFLLSLYFDVGKEQ